MVQFLKVPVNGNKKNFENKYFMARKVCVTCETTCQHESIDSFVKRFVVRHKSEPRPGGSVVSMSDS